jgi:hypothetical protein
MGYGLRVREASGNITLDTSDIVVRVRYSIVISAGVDGSVELSDISGKTVYPIPIPLEVNKAAHSVSVSGTTLSWVHQDTNCLSSDTLIVLIIVD